MEMPAIAEEELKEGRGVMNETTRGREYEEDTWEEEIKQEDHGGDNGDTS